MAEKEKDPRGPRDMTPEDFLKTATTLEIYARAFIDVANQMKETGVKSISVTGAASMKYYLSRADAHYRSCREQLGYLATGEKIPLYSFEEPPQPPSRKKTPRR